MHGLADVRPLKPCLRGLAGHLFRGDAAGPGQRLAQPVTLRVGRAFKPEPPACIAFTGQQHLVKALRPAQRVAALQQPHQGRGAELSAAVYVAVFTRHHVGQLTAVGGHAQALAQPAQQFRAALFVADVPGPQLWRRGALAQIVPQAGKAHREWGAQLTAHVQHHHQVHAGVDFGVVLGALRHAPQAVHFRQQPRQRAATTQHVEHARRFALHQPARQLLPHTLRHQRIDLAAGHHLPRQLHRLVGHVEAAETGRKTRQPQDAHRVFGKGRRHMAQAPGSQIGLAAMGVDDVAVVVRGHGVDGQVTPRQVLLQGHIRRGVEAEAGIARCGFALGAGQGIFLARGGVDEDREVAPHHLEARGQQRVGRAAHHGPVALTHFQPEQGIANRTTHQIDLHGGAV